MLTLAFRTNNKLHGFEIFGIINKHNSSNIYQFYGRKVHTKQCYIITVQLCGCHKHDCQICANDQHIFVNHVKNVTPIDILKKTYPSDIECDEYQYLISYFELRLIEIGARVFAGQEIDAFVSLMNENAKKISFECYDKVAYRRQTTLMLAVTHNLVNVAKSLLNMGSNVNEYCINDGKTPLIYCAEHNSIGCAKLLLRKGAHIDVTTICGMSPLVIAIKEYYVNMVKLLLKHNADVTTNYDKMSPLKWGCFLGPLSVVKKLTAKCREFVQSNGVTFLTCAIIGGNYDIMCHLLNIGAKIASAQKLLLLALSVQDCNMDKIIDYLCKMSRECLFERDDSGNFPLTIAGCNNFRSFKHLLNMSDVFYDVPDLNGQNSLHKIAQTFVTTHNVQCISSIKLLIDHGYIPYLVDVNGATGYSILHNTSPFWADNVAEYFADKFFELITAPNKYTYNKQINIATALSYGNLLIYYDVLSKKMDDQEMIKSAWHYACGQRKKNADINNKFGEKYWNTIISHIVDNYLIDNTIYIFTSQLSRNTFMSIGSIFS